MTIIWLTLSLFLFVDSCRTNSICTPSGQAFWSMLHYIYQVIILVSSYIILGSVDHRSHPPKKNERLKRTCRRLKVEVSFVCVWGEGGQWPPLTTLNSAIGWTYPTSRVKVLGQRVNNTRLAMQLVTLHPCSSFLTFFMKHNTIVLNASRHHCREWSITPHWALGL
jgi:hypothetical protein